jgi:SAM-dependent methyltransferase
MPFLSTCFCRKWLAFLSLACWILYFSSGAYARPTISNGDTLSAQQFIEGCAAYRNEFIGDLEGVLIEFNALCDSLQSESDQPEAYEIFRKQYMHDFLRCEIQDWYEMIKDAIPDSLQLEKEHVQALQKWAMQNYLRLFQLNFLVSNRILESSPPFRLTNLKDFWEEIRRYDLRAGQVFFDIGAGPGTISFILGGTGLPLHIYLTEVSKDYLSLLREEVFRRNQMNQPGEFLVTEGQERSLGIDHQIVADRILLREVLHHMDHPDDILQAIRRQLKPEGRLIVVESVKELEPNTSDRCRKAMEIAKVKKILTEGGFELEQQKIIGSSYVLRYKSG